MKILLFLLLSINCLSQETKNFVYDEFTLTIVAENNSLNVFARNTSLRDLKLEMLNPVGKRVHKVIIAVKSSSRILINFSDGANGYYNIKATHKRIKYSHYYIKINSVVNGVLTNNISFLLTYNMR